MKRRDFLKWMGLGAMAVAVPLSPIPRVPIVSSVTGIADILAWRAHAVIALTPVATAQFVDGMHHRSMRGEWPVIGHSLHRTWTFAAPAGAPTDMPYLYGVTV